LNSFSVANLSHLNTGCSPAAYGDFTAAAGVDTIQLNQALAYNFTATNTFGSAWLGIWIDFNADLDFTDPGEQVFISTAAFGGATPLNGSFTMPTGLTNGFTRMRAIVRYAGAPTGPCTPGGSFGETHDYTVQILSAPTCLPVSAVNATNITPTSADINWTSTTNNYEVEYGLAGFNQGSGTTVTGILANTTNIAGLLSNTSYDVYVRANCGGGDFSPWVKLTFKTACSFFATPFSENFATTPTGSTTSNTVPTCWTYAETTGHAGGGYVTAFSNPRSIPNQYQFTNSSNITDNLMLISPLIQGLDSNNKQVNFWMKSNTATYNSSIVVGTVGSIANPLGTFDPIDTVSSGLNFTEFIVEFTTAKGYNGTDQYIAFLYREPNGTFRSAFIDDITVEKIPACQKPLGLGVSTFTATTASLTWLSSNSTFSVEWGPCGFVQGTGNFVNNISGTTTSISGLTGNTCYDFYVRSNCGVNGNSVWNGPFSFTTAITPAWLENFNLGYNPTATIPIPARWSELYGFAANPSVFTSTFSAWTQDGFLNVGFTGAVRLSVFNTSTTVRDWTVSPPIDLSNGPWQFYFDMGITSSGGTAAATMGNDDTVMVIVSTNNGVTWNRSNAIAKFHAGTGITNVGSTYTADLSAFSGQTVRIALFATSTVSNSPLPTYDIHIDNVGVRVPPTCPAPTSAVVSNITTTTVGLGWTAGLGNVSYNVEWGPCGFVQGTGSTSNVAFSGTTAVVSGLSPATCYDFYIQGDCGSGNGQSAWIGPFSATTLCLPIAAPVVENFDGPTWIVGTGFNNAGSQINQCWDRNSEFVTSDFTWGPRADVTGLGTTTGPSGDHTTGTTNFLYTESSVGISPSVATLWSQQINTSALTNPEMRFWYHMFGSGIGKLVVSLDTGNGGFFKVDSIVGQQQTSKAAAWKEMIVSLIPFAGKTIQVKWDATKLNTLSDIAIDDFSVISGPTCPQPTQLSAGNLTGFTADLNWTSNGTNFKVEWGPQGFTPGTGGSTISGITSSNYTLTGLTPITCYDYYVRSICSPTDSSVLSGPFTFCTPCAPFTAPYTQDFDALTLNVGAPCFGVAFNGTPSTLPYQQVRTNQFNIVPQTAPNVLQLYSGNNSGIDVVWVSPEFSDLDSNNRWVTFGAVSNYFSLATIPVSLVVGSMTSATDPSTFSPEDTITFTAQYQWENAFVLMNNVPSGNKYVGFRLLTTATFTSIYMDNFVYEKVPTCPNPYQLAVTGSTTTSISLSWTSNSTAANSIIRATPTLGGATLSAVVPNTGSGTIAGLTDGTAYSLTVADICSPGDTSSFSSPAVGATKCLPFALTYAQDFNTWAAGTPAPLCWQDQGTVAWKPVPGNGGTVAEADFWSNSTGTMVMSTPLITISQKAILRFDWSRNLSTFYDDKLYIRGRVAGAPAWDTLAVYQGPTFSTPGATNTAPAPVFNKDTIVLDTNWVGSDIEIQFYGVTDFGPDLFIDNVVVEADPAFLSCPNPTGLAASAVTSNSAVVSYTGGGTSFQVSYGIGLTNGNQGTIVAVTGSSTTLTGLTPASQYCFFVREICAPGDTSNWSASSCFATACVSFAMPFLENFQAWPVGDDAPLCFSAAGGTQKWDRYTTGTNLVARANFWNFTAPNDFRLTTPQIVMSSAAQLRYKWSHLYSSFYPDEMRIYAKPVAASTWDTILVINGPAFNSNDGAGNTTPGTFVWDTLALDPAWVGQTIEIQFHGISGFGPDLYIDSVIVESLGGAICPAPTALASANIVCDAFDVSFTSGSGTSYAEYGPAGFAPGSGTVVSPAASPLSISGLTAGTNYEVYVYDVCPSDTSLPAGPLAVTTASSPKPTASFVWTVTPTLTNATVAFDASGSTGGTTYSWNFGNSSTGTGVNANGTYTANGTYNVTLIVSNACGSDTLTQAVTVNGIGVAEAALAASFQAYPNPTRGKVALSFSLMYSNAATIEIMDLSGRVVWVESAAVNGTYRKELDLSSYAAGVYLVRVSSEDGVVARRLVVE
jgi:hypothetical protein